MFPETTVPSAVNPDPPVTHTGKPPARISAAFELGVPTVVPNTPETAPVLFKSPLIYFSYALF